MTSLTSAQVALVARKVQNESFKNTVPENQDWLIHYVHTKLEKGIKLNSDVQEAVAQAVKEVLEESK